MLIAIYWLEFVGGGGGVCQGLLGCLDGFDLLDGVYLLGFAGRGSLGQVCSFRFALSGLRGKVC